jgi:AcrR family transcriptional regulator
VTTEEKILDSALMLFVKKGFSTTTSEITQNANVSSGILFHYFPTKENLILILYSNILLEYYQVGISLIDETMIKDPIYFEENIKMAWKAQVNWGVDHWDKFQYLQQFENTPFAEKYEPNENPKIQELQNYLIQQTQSAIDRGIAKNLPYEFLIDNGVALTASTIKYLHENPQMRQDEHFMEQAMQIYLSVNKRQVS